MSQVKRGRAAELLFQAACLRADLDCFCPATEDGRVDLVVGPHHYRCQVKVMEVIVLQRATRHLPLTKRIGPKGSGKRFRYSERDVDFMVGVCLTTYAIYIVPIEQTFAWAARMSESALRRLGTLNAFHLLHAGRGEVARSITPRRMIGRRPPFDFAYGDMSLPLGPEFQ